MLRLYVCLLIGTLAPFKGLLLGVAGQNSTLLQDVLSLRSQVYGLQQQVASLSSVQTTVNNVANQQTTLFKDIDAVTASLHDARTVAFMATLNHTVTSIGKNQRLVFDHVVTNTEHVYDATTGEFIAPAQGNYIFFMTLTNLHNYKSSFKMMKNGEKITHGIAQASTVTGFEEETTTIVVMVNLRKNDRVWVQNDGYPNLHEGLTGNDLSSFAGYILTPVV